jgi:hypothetical protein
MLATLEVAGEIHFRKCDQIIGMLSSAEWLRFQQCQLYGFLAENQAVSKRPVASWHFENVLDIVWAKGGAMCKMLVGIFVVGAAAVEVNYSRFSCSGQMRCSWRAYHW